MVTHLARNNTQWQDIEGQEILVTLQGPHGYISPTWYENRRGVPTWDYQAVHLYGTCQVFTELHRLKDVVERTADKYEAGNEQPWDGHYDEKMYQAIVGLEIAITDIQAKFKLSQNRTNRERANIVKQLIDQSQAELAAQIDAVEPNSGIKKLLLFPRSSVLPSTWRINGEETGRSWNFGKVLSGCRDWHSPSSSTPLGCWGLPR